MGDAFTALYIHPLDRLAPGIFEALARALEPLMRVPGVRALASQYLVAARA
jgi:hypothetical protein